MSDFVVGLGCLLLAGSAVLHHARPLLGRHQLVAAHVAGYPALVGFLYLA